MLCRALLCKILSSSFFKSLFIVRDSKVSVLREREKNLLTTPRCVHCFCRSDSDCLYQLFSPMYYLPVVVLSPLTSNLFELQRSLIRINLLPGSSELQVLGIWRRSSELLVFRVLGTWSSESSSLHLSSESSALDQKRNIRSWDCS